ncbi:MAG TPA: hypothetical protein VF466_05225 [Candidatus Saccharimonadales bacterium]
MKHPQPFTRSKVYPAGYVFVALPKMAIAGEALAVVGVNKASRSLVERNVFLADRTGYYLLKYKIVRKLNYRHRLISVILTIRKTLICRNDTKSQKV